MDSDLEFDTWEKLKTALTNDIKNNTTKDKKYVLTNSIDCNGDLLEPLGNGTSYSFDGTLDGNGYSIQNIKISCANTYNLGFFSKIGGTGIVQNLHFENVQMEQKINTK